MGGKSPSRQLVVTPQGFWLSGQSVGLDAEKPMKVNFISHALTRRPWDHQQIVATSDTLALAALGHPRHKDTLSQRALLPRFKQQFALGNLYLRLFPSGFHPGSSCLAIRQQGKRLLYLGPFQPDPPLTAQPIAFPRADVLIIRPPPSGFLPRRNDRAERTAAELRAVVLRAIQKECQPVVLCHPILEATTVCALLQSNHYQLSGHFGIAAAVRIAASAFPERFPLHIEEVSARTMGTPSLRPRVFIWPLSVSGKTLVRRLKNPYLIATEQTSEWSGLPIDACRPILRGPSLQQLVSVLKQIQPRKVIFIGNSGAPAIDHLRRGGIAVDTITSHVQLPLRF